MSAESTARETGLTTELVSLIYTESLGTNCVLGGQQGIVTGLIRESRGTSRDEWRKPTDAFVKLEGPADAQGRFIAPGPMLHVSLGEATGDRRQHSEVLGWRVIDRDEFDHLNDLDTLRRELGWSDSKEMTIPWLSTRVSKGRA